MFALILHIRTLVSGQRHSLGFAIGEYRQIISHLWRGNELVTVSWSGSDALFPLLTYFCQKKTVGSAVKSENSMIKLESHKHHEQKLCSLTSP